MFNYLLSIKFEYPYFFALLFLFILCSIFCKAKTPTYIIPHLNIFEQSRHKTLIVTSVFKYLAIIGSIIALSSPYRQLDTQIIKNDGIDIVLNLDTSGSMKEKGFNRNNPNEDRFSVVKDIVKDFIPKRANDNIALVVFGKYAMMASPLSFDKSALKEIASYLDIGVAGDSRTAILDSLALSVNILKDSKAKSKVIILLTDGEDNVSRIPLDVIVKLLKKYSIKVYAIGIGESNRIMLNQIAKPSGGKFYRANSKEQLTDIYNEINSLEKSKIESNKIILKEYLFFYPLFLAIISLILYIYLKNRE